MHHRCKQASLLLYTVRHPLAPEGRRSASESGLTGGDLRIAERVERLACARRQAAEALGVSAATLDRRAVPVIATVATDWGGWLIPVSPNRALPTTKKLPVDPKARCDSSTT